MSGFVLHGLLFCALAVVVSAHYGFYGNSYEGMPEPEFEIEPRREMEFDIFEPHHEKHEKKCHKCRWATNPYEFNHCLYCCKHECEEKHEKKHEDEDHGFKKFWKSWHPHHRRHHRRHHGHHRRHWGFPKLPWKRFARKSLLRGIPKLLGKLFG